MTRPQQSARPWLVRGLLVLVFLAGMGLWQGAHGPEPTVATHSSAPTSECDECHLVRITAVSTVAGARSPHQPSGTRPAATAPEPILRTRLVPAVTLATIGVRRT